jgi:hypothetical protein
MMTLSSVIGPRANHGRTHGDLITVRSVVIACPAHIQ